MSIRTELTSKQLHLLKILAGNDDSVQQGREQFKALGMDCFKGYNLSGMELIKVNLSEANLNGTNLRGANLRGAVLKGAQLEKATLYEADLRGAKLEKAILYGVDLRGANLRGANLRGAFYDSKTQWPDDFTVASSGALIRSDNHITAAELSTTSLVLEVLSTNYEVSLLPGSGPIWGNRSLIEAATTHARNIQCWVGKEEIAKAVEVLEEIACDRHGDLMQQVSWRTRLN